MALESVTTIYDLNAANPTSSDPVSQADDHLRNLKTGILASFAGSTGSSGYQKLGKIIIQWGSTTTSATPAAGTTVTFPLAFPTAVASVVASNSTSSSAGITVFAGTATTTNFVVAASVASLGVYWIAIGY